MLNSMFVHTLGLKFLHYCSLNEHIAYNVFINYSFLYGLVSKKKKFLMQVASDYINIQRFSTIQKQLIN